MLCGAQIDHVFALALIFLIYRLVKVLVDVITITRRGPGRSISGIAFENATGLLSQ